MPGIGMAPPTLPWCIQQLNKQAAFVHVMCILPVFKYHLSQKCSKAAHKIKGGGGGNTQLKTVRTQ